jgi:hypothetical protein
MGGLDIDPHFSNSAPTATLIDRKTIELANDFN